MGIRPPQGRDPLRGPGANPPNLDDRPHGEAKAGPSGNRDSYKLNGDAGARRTVADSGKGVRGPGALITAKAPKGAKGAGEGKGPPEDPSAELERLAEEMFPGSSEGPKRYDALRIMILALDNLRSRFKPDQVLEGRAPSEAAVIASLRRGYYGHHGERAGRDNSGIRVYIEPFGSYVAENAKHLGLVGKRPPANNQHQAGNNTGLPSPADVALRVLRARAMIRKIEDLARQIPSDHDGNFSALLTEARILATDMAKLGGDEAETSASLRGRSARDEALQKARRLQWIHKEMRLAAFESTAALDWNSAEIHQRRFNEEINNWIEGKEGITEADAKVLRDTVRTYIAFWQAKSRQSGGLARLAHSQEVLESAIQKTLRTVDDAKRQQRLGGLATQLVHHLVRIDSKRGRTARLASEKTKGAQEAQADIIPLSQRITGPEALENALGPGLYGALNEFYAAIRVGEKGRIADESMRPDIARAFYRLSFLYFRHGAETYGGNMLDEIKKRGLEAAHVAEILAGVDDVALYSADALEVLRSFFAENVKADPPPIEELIPDDSLVVSIASGRPGASEEDKLSGVRYLRYEDGMGMREFIGQLRGMDRGRVKEFEAATGINWETFMHWGGVRPNPGTPSAIDWAAMRTFEIVKGKRPGSVSDNQWDCYIEKLDEAGRIEDITTEPRLGHTLDAILPAYHFMQEVAAEQGLRIDFLEYLCAIYPIARRLRAGAGNGGIRIMQPRFMYDLPYYNWGYRTFAAKVYQSEYATDVVRSTLVNHIQRDTIPELWDIRRYTGPLAQSAFGGQRLEDELYFFAAGLMRWAPLIDNGIRVFNRAGDQVTHPTETISRFHIRIIDDVAEYAPSADPEAGAARALFSDVRRGIFSQRLGFIGVYLSAIDILPKGTELIDADGNPVDPNDLNSEYEELVKGDLVYSALLADRSPSAAYRSHEDMERISQFYAGVKTFAERLAAGIRIRGHIGTPQGEIAFQAAPRAEGHAVELIDGEYVTVPVDDMMRMAVKEAWSGNRLANLLRLRVITGYAIASGDLEMGEAANRESVMAAVLPLWSGDGVSLDAAAADYVRLEEAAHEADVSPFGDALRGMKPTGGRRAQRTYEPLLPARRKAPDWQDQFRTFGKGRDLSQNAIENAMAAIGDYCVATRNFQRYFWPHTLENCIRTHASDEKEASLLYDAIVAFFPTIGVASAIRREKGVDPEHRIERSLAEWTAADYIELFPCETGAKRWQVPDDPTLIAKLAELHIAEHAEAKPERPLVVATARQIIGEHNERSDPAPWMQNDELPLDGLLRARMEEFSGSWTSGDDRGAPDMDLVRRAYFRLLPSIRKGKAVSRDDASMALSSARAGMEASDNDTAFLEAFVAHQSDGIARILSMAQDSEKGITAYARNNFSTEGDGGDALETLAAAYAAGRLAENLPTDLEVVSVDLVGDSFAEYPDIVAYHAGFQRHILRSWLANTEKELGNRIGDAMFALEAAGEETGEPPSSYEEFLKRAAMMLAGDSFEALAHIETDWHIVRSLLGREAPEETLAQTASRIYDGRVVPNQMAHEARLGEAEAELFRIVGSIADLARQSIEIYTGFRRRPDFDAMDEGAAQSVMHNAETNLGKVIELQGEAKDAAKFRCRAAAIIEELDGDPAAEYAKDMFVAAMLAVGRESSTIPQGTITAIEGLLEFTGETLAIAENNITGWHGLAEARIRQIKEDDEASYRENAAGTLTQMARDTARELEAEIIAFRSFEDSDLSRFRERARALRERIAAAHESYDAFDKTARLIEAFASEVEARSSELDGMVSRLSVILDGGETRGISVKDDESAAAILKAAREIRRADARSHAEALNDATLKLDRFVLIAKATGTHALQTRSGIDGLPDEMRRLLYEAEERLPMTNALGLPSPSVLAEGDVVIDGDYKHSFEGAPTKGKALGQARAQLDHLIRARLLVIREGSYLISTKEEEKIAAWKQSGREEDISVSVLFGDSVTLARGRTGVHTKSPAGLNRPHPYASLVHTLGMALGKNSPEIRLLDLITREGDGNEPLRMGLFGALAAREPAANPEAAHGLIRRFALANRAALTAAHPSPCSSWFRARPLREVETEGAKAPPIYGDSYSRERHSHLAGRTAAILARPGSGRIRINLGAGNQMILIADVLEAEREGTRAGGHLNMNDIGFEVLDERALKWVGFQRWARSQEMPWHEIGEMPLSIGTEPYHSSPHNIRVFRFCRALYLDPGLAELGWLFDSDSSGHVDGRFHNFVEQLSGSIAARPPFDLYEAQEFATGLYRDFRDGFASMPELDRVRKPGQFIMTWLSKVLEESLATKGIEGVDAERMYQAIGNAASRHDDLRREILMLAMLDYWWAAGKGSSGEKQESAKKNVREGLGILAQHFAFTAEVTPDLLGKIAGLGLRDFYRENRPQILSTARPMLTRLTGLHRPGVHPLFAGTDDELSTGYPEVSRVGPWQLARVMEETQAHPIEGMPSLRQMMDRLPEFARAMAIIAVACDGLRGAFPRGFSEEFEAISREYERLNEFVGDSADDDSARKAIVNGCRTRFIRLYGSQAMADVEGRNAIIEGLGREIYPGMTAGRWLTGVDEPWKPAPETMEELPPLERLSLIMPEAFRVRPEHIASFKRMVDSSTATPIHLRHAVLAGCLRDLMDQFPELAGTILIDLHTQLSAEEYGDVITTYVQFEEALQRGSTIDRDYWLGRFVSAHTDYGENPRYLMAMRRELAAGVGGKGNRSREIYKDYPSGMTLAQILTGSERPWLPDGLEEFATRKEILPQSDIDRIDEMTEAEINERIDALGVLPRTPMGLRRAIEEYRSARIMEYEVLRGERVPRAAKETAAEQFEQLPITFHRILVIAHLAGRDSSLYQGLREHLRREFSAPAADRIDYGRCAYRYLVANRDDVIAAIGKIDRSRSQGAVRSPQPKTALVRPIHGGDYDEEVHAKGAKVSRYSIEHPDYGLLVKHEGERTIPIGMIDSEAMAAVDDRSFVPAQVYEPETGRTTQVKDLVALIRRKDRDLLRPRFSSPLYILMNDLSYRVHMDPSLMELAWMWQSTEWEDFVTRIVTPIAHTMPGERPPLTLHEAQEIAVAVYQDKGKWAPVIAEPDAAVAREFPETALIGPHVIYTALETIYRGSEGSQAEKWTPRKYKNTIETLMLFPEFAGAVMIVLDSPCPPPDRADLVSTVREAKDLAQSGKLAKAKGMLRKKLLEIYSKGKEAIKCEMARTRDTTTSLSKARWLTGLEDPWNGEIDRWERIGDPVDRLRIAIPELTMIRQDVIRGVMGEAKSDSVWETTEFASEPGATVISMMRAVPDLAGAMLVDVLMMSRKNSLRPEVLEDIIELHRTMNRASAEEIKGGAFMERFVSARLSVSYVADVRSFMRIKLGEEENLPVRMLRNVPGATDDVTIGEILTGKKEPWLPELGQGEAGSLSGVDMMTKFPPLDSEEENGGTNGSPAAPAAGSQGAPPAPAAPDVQGALPPGGFDPSYSVASALAMHGAVVGMIEPLQLPQAGMGIFANSALAAVPLPLAGVGF